MQQLALVSFDGKSLYIIEEVFALIRFCLLGVLLGAILGQPVCLLPTSRILLQTLFFLQLSHLSVVVLLTLFRLALLDFGFDSF